MFKLPIPTRLTDYLGEAVVWTVIYLFIIFRANSKNHELINRFQLATFRIFHFPVLWAFRIQSILPEPSNYF